MNWRCIALTVDAAVLRKRTEQDRIFQLLASLSPDFEDLRSHILMNSKLPSISEVYLCNIQREEIHRKVMSRDVNSGAAGTHAYHAKAMPRNGNSGMSDSRGQPRQVTDARTFKGKQSDLKFSFCHNTGHLTKRC